MKLEGEEGARTGAGTCAFQNSAAQLSWRSVSASPPNKFPVSFPSLCYKWAHVTCPYTHTCFRTHFRASGLHLGHAPACSVLQILCRGQEHRKFLSINLAKSFRRLPPELQSPHVVWRAALASSDLRSRNTSPPKTPTKPLPEYPTKSPHLLPAPDQIVKLIATFSNSHRVENNFTA